MKNLTYTNKSTSNKAEFSCKVSSMKEFKNKVKGFELLFNEFPVISFYGCKEYEARKGVELKITGEKFSILGKKYFLDSDMHISFFKKQTACIE